ncbi:hypothetical protein ASPZODRAFT_100662 [Penicilliopsis zonata CBS 506.65]|uniref:Uncharacterized protein n=1 Tax=Penicilliopsis zonata CBS 506.65 TaxID=1073090 RepID=A0A1L9SBU2_9EURO|nr:hypothetical protein ASPZODRAFT_100662 [Penicilliopsis zonata CBS 506.65]OJJ44636.1 hypothetical protein ASPZODRAFT_100662 [Penicilliopsis zonata CBS 506.65]
MMRPSDPRIRQTINRFSHNLESANESAQEGLYAFSHHYITPCVAAIGNCVHACAAPCLPSREDQLRRRRRGRAESVFDFYDDWDNEATGDGILGWGHDELDRLLAGSGLARGGGSEQPRKQRKMSYGTRNVRRKSSLLVPDERNDPTVIPSSSFLGFLERFPWRVGARGLKYRPSAADLQDNPGGLRKHLPEDEPLMEAAEEAEDGPSYQRHLVHGRERSGTHSSRGTSNSLSSRGDLILSDEEEDAVPLDDEFALTLGRRNTGIETDETPGGKPASMKRSISGTLSQRTMSSKGSRKKDRRNTNRSKRVSEAAEMVHEVVTPSIEDLKLEDKRVALEEESEVSRKRVAAQKLAVSKGLDQRDGKVRKKSFLFISHLLSLYFSKLTRTQNAPWDTNVGSSAASANGGPHTAIGMVRSFSQSSDWQSMKDQTEPFPPLPQTPPSNVQSDEAPEPPSPSSQSDSAPMVSAEDDLPSDPDED